MTLSLVVIVPDSVDGLGALERALSADTLRSWLSSLPRENLLLHLPRFRASDRFALNEVLAELGMPSSFNPVTADFSRMTGRRDLYVDAAIHEAFIEVDENGTEAAAATGIETSFGGGRIVRGEIRIDRPFLYLIRDKQTDSILFLGRVVNPL